MINGMILILMSWVSCSSVEVSLGVPLVVSQLVSSPEPSGSQGELIVYPWSGVRRPSSSVVRPHFSNIFSSETAWLIKAKFYVEPPWGGGTKVYINGRGHMTKMAATPIYGKKPFKNLLQNRWADFHETWYVASGTPAHHSLYK